MEACIAISKVETTFPTRVPKLITLLRDKFPQRCVLDAAADAGSFASLQEKKPTVA